MAELKVRLADPALYTRSDAAAAAAELSREVADAVGALERWSVGSVLARRRAASR